jgi:hypothetical protein
MLTIAARKTALLEVCGGDRHLNVLAGYLVPLTEMASYHISATGDRGYAKNRREAI